MPSSTDGPVSRHADTVGTGDVTQTDGEGGAELEHSRQTRSQAERRHRLVFRATLVSGVLIALGAALGLLRDLTLARYFGASGETDAFLVAWTLPETAAPLLIDNAMAFLLVPAFTKAILESDAVVRQLVRRTLPRVFGLLVLLGGACATLSPLLVDVLAPGLANPALAVQCMRLTSIAVIAIGMTGYLAAALRAHGIFGPPAGIYVANNLGIIAIIVLLHGQLDVLSAALGVAVGALLMVGVQMPSFLRNVFPAGRSSVSRGAASSVALVSFGAFVPIATYTLTRHAQVFVERFLAASLEPGTISHLNYAQKIGQLPVTLILVIVLVSFPALVASIARGDYEDARRRIETELRTMSIVVLLATAYLIAFAPAIVRLLFEHGAFGPNDTAATAVVLRVYVLGLLGQAFVGVLCRCYFSQRPTWYPAGVMALGLLVTAVVGAGGSPLFGAPAIAAANAAGITVTAMLLLRGVRHRVVPVSPTAIAGLIARLMVPAVLSCGAGLAILPMLAGLPSSAVVVVGGVVVVAVYLTILIVIDREGSRQMRALVMTRMRREG
jgi:putative peptidoglycan lipid II flippase